MSSVNESVGGNRSTHAPTLDLHEIQATVLRPRPAPYFGTHVLLRVDDARAGRELPAPAHTSRRFRRRAGGARPIPGCRSGSAMRASRRSGFPEDSLQSFPEAFRVGMAARARQLGDDGVNDPKNWDRPFGNRCKSTSG